MKKILLLLALAPMAVLAKTSTPAGFTDNLDEAFATAKASGKYVYACFSGSDWCGWCKKLDKEVFAEPEFLAGVTNDYVLVMVDSPSNKSLLSEKAKEQNPKLVKEYKVSGFPTVLIMDSDGGVIETAGYRKGGPQPYVEYLQGVKKSAAGYIALSAAIANLKKGDPVRLAKIDEFLSGLDNEQRENRAELADELLANDPDGKYAAKYPLISIVMPIKEKFRNIFSSLNGEFAKRISAAAQEAGVKPKDLSDEKRKEVLKEVDALAFERLSALKSEIDAAKAKSPESVQGDLQAIDDQVLRVLKNIKKD